MSAASFDDLFAFLSVERRLVTEFFVVFARFEYALKRARFVQRDTADQVQADWDKFANAIESSFDPTTSQDLLEAVKYRERTRQGLRRLWEAFCLGERPVEAPEKKASNGCCT